MKSIIINELATDFLIQGLGLHPTEDLGFVGKIGRHEVEMVQLKEYSTNHGEEVLVVGQVESEQFRPGDVLMVGSDDLLDRAFQTLDEMEQRGVVISLTPPADPNQVYVEKDEVFELVSVWKENKVPFLCLFLAEPIDSEGQAKLVTLIRKIFS